MSNSFTLPEVPAGPVGLWWEPLPDGRVLCTLCPRYCKIPVGSRGFCHIRRNINGQLITTGYGRSTGFGIDPVEKKPLYHFYPGSKVLSFGTVGCNLGCKFCQNWHISKSRQNLPEQIYSAVDIVEMALEHDCSGIAYTYNDPIIFGEWVLDVAAEARARGLKNILVSNGFITPDARRDIYGAVDAINVDLKAFSQEFYRHLTLASLEPVLDTLRWLVADTTVWVEITTLVIPGENDDNHQLNELTKFIARELGSEIPLHFSAFHPDFKLRDHQPTPLSTLERAARIAHANGIDYVYLGNVHSTGSRDTNCPSCGRPVIERNYYLIENNYLADDKCPHCGKRINGHFHNNGEGK